MATAALPQDPDLDQLRNQARELQRAVRRGEPAALTRVSRWHPDPPSADRFPLTAAQLVLARQHGFTSWARMRRYVQIVTARAWTPGQPPPDDESLADRFLRLACLTGGDHRSDLGAAAELLAEHPELPRQNLFAAAACADVTEVRRHLAGRPAGADASGGPHGWSPLLYQAYARHNPDVGRSATLETARLLLDAGADPNDGRFWHALPTPFTVLTGVLGHGEHRQPWHPHAVAFARLLLERGADPNDGQTLYNRMFGSNDDHLVLLFEFGLGRDTRGPWHRLLGESLESPAEMLRSLLAWAITHDQRRRVALLAEHGVDIVSPFTEPRSPRRGTPVEVALLNGHRELAGQLLALGARPARLSAADAFVAAVLAGDTEAARQTPAQVIATVRRKRTGLVTWAAAQGAPNAVELLATAGFDVNALGRSDIPGNEPWHTALHVAAENGNLTLARTLLDLGADPNIPDQHYKSTPLGWARYFGQPALIDLLEPVTRRTTMSEQAQTPEPGVTDEAVRRYRDEMDSDSRPVFDRLHRLIVVACPDAELVLSYGMPTYRIGRRRLNIGVWRHGLSLYVSPSRDGGFTARHPELASGKGTIKLKPADAASIPDEEFQDLILAALRA